MVARRPMRLGSRFVLGGLLASMAPWVGLVSVTLLIGTILIGAGITFIILALEAQTGGKGKGPLLLGLVCMVTGACLLIWPAMSAVTLTALLATHLTLSGVLTLAFAFDLQPARGWSWLLVGGSIALLLAASMWFQFPLTGALAVGSLIGLNLVAMGLSLVAIHGFEASAQSGSSADTDMSI